MKYRIISLVMIGFLLASAALGYVALSRKPAPGPARPKQTPKPKSSPPARASAQWKIMTWGNDTQEWSGKLNLSGMRWTDDSPAAAVESGNAEARRLNVQKYFISIDKQDPSTLKDYARQYSELSLRNLMLQEIAPDDFAFKVLYYWYEELHMNSGQERLRPKSECVKNTKTLNQIALDVLNSEFNR